MKAILILLACCLISCEGGYSSYSYQTVPSTTVRTYRSYTPSYNYYTPSRRVYYPLPVTRYNYSTPLYYTTGGGKSPYRTPRYHSVRTKSYKAKCP